MQPTDKNFCYKNINIKKKYALLYFNSLIQSAVGEPSAARAPTLSLGLPAVSPGQVTRVSNAHHRAAVGRERGWRIGTRVAPQGEFRGEKPAPAGLDER